MRRQAIRTYGVNEAVTRLKALSLPDNVYIEIYFSDEEELEPKKKTNKWGEELAAEIKALNIQEDVFEHIKASTKEFREDFCFKHDLVEDNQ